MKTAPRIGIGIAAGAGVAALTYGGVAATAWLRYGKRRAIPVTTLSHYIEEPDVSVRHRIVIDAPPAVAFRTACNLDLAESKVAKVLFDARAAIMGCEKAQQTLPNTLLDALKAVGWSVLEETPDQEIVFGTVCEPWRKESRFRAIPPEEFAAFAEPGHAKIIWNLAVDPLGGTRSLLRTETRVITTDAESRRLFRRYWSFFSPGIKLIRLEMLRRIKRKAEKTV